MQTHPTEEQIALYSGGDLGRWERWRLARHFAHCAQCRQDVQALRDASNQFRELAGQMAQLPNGLKWDRLAEEMTGNIRVGLAAGEAIASFDKPARSRRRFHWNAALVAAGAMAIFAVAFWTSLPPQQADHLLSSLERVRTERIGPLVHSSPAAKAAASEEVVLEASSSGIQVKENGRAMSLIPRSDGTTVSVSMHGSAGVRYVDSDTGQVTTTKVYYAEQ
ncbi:MAG TPA: hypothetical protein VFW44_01555 [Bryobacteraceae bacterium]|nr:hypothetical protein [Bryobacteraceae bacterium]